MKTEKFAEVLVDRIKRHSETPDFDIGDLLALLAKYVELKMLRNKCALPKEQEREFILLSDLDDTCRSLVWYENPDDCRATELYQLLIQQVRARLGEMDDRSVEQRLKDDVESIGYCVMQGDGEICLDGVFSLKDLKTIVSIMEGAQSG